MNEQWLMDSGFKSRIEKVVQELITTRGATQAQLRRFFASARLRKRMLEGFDDMLREDARPAVVKEGMGAGSD